MLISFGLILVGMAIILWNGALMNLQVLTPLFATKIAACARMPGMDPQRFQAATDTFVEKVVEWQLDEIISAIRAGILLVVFGSVSLLVQLVMLLWQLI